RYSAQMAKGYKRTITQNLFKKMVGCPRLRTEKEGKTGQAKLLLDLNHTCDFTRFLPKKDKVFSLLPKNDSSKVSSLCNLCSLMYILFFKSELKSK
ncbi:MAG: hypothetical protein ACK56F_32175, partial [bacterium]